MFVFFSKKRLQNCLGPFFKKISKKNQNLKLQNSRFYTIFFLLLQISCTDTRFSQISATGPASQSTAPSNLKDIEITNTVTTSNNKVDIILIVDDSKSMLSDNQKLAAKLSNFVGSLENSALDWQVCATITNAVQMGGASQVWGASIYWQNSSIFSTSLGIVLKKGQSDLPNIFASTINYIGAGWAGTDDERAIKAAYNHVYNGDYNYSNASGCYRSDAAIAFIIISDEDERSIGGDKSQQYYPGEYQPLEDQDIPENFVAYIKSTFGNDKHFTVNSIIVKPGDTNCMKIQDVEAKSHYGIKYAELSNTTAGGIGSICDSDFLPNLNLFTDKIISSLTSVPLPCAPVGDVIVSVTPAIRNLNNSLSGLNLVFNKSIPAGSTLDIKFKCDESRSPSSLKSSAIQLFQESYFKRIIHFIKNIF